MTDILPCPFCGSPVTYLKGGDLYSTNYDVGVGCAPCGAKITDQYRSHAIAAWNTRTTTPAPNAGAVKVKKLEWVMHPTAPIWRCDTAIGTYKIFAMGSNPSWDFDSATDPKDKLSKRADTPDAAKAAAQADYAARILAALETTPDPRDAVIARLVEALESIIGQCSIDREIIANAIAAAKEVQP